MAGLTLDAGAIIAAERNDSRFWSFWAVVLDIDKAVPAAVVAQVWRGDRSARVARILAACEIVPLTEPVAKAVGELCGRARTKDIAGAAVVVCAARRGDDILTGDVADIRRLVSSTSGVGRVLDLSQLRR